MKKTLTKLCGLLLAAVLFLVSAGLPASVSAEEPVKLTEPINITYDESVLFLTTRLQANSITELMALANITNWGYNEESPDPWYVDNGTQYSCFVRRNEYDDPGRWDKYFSDGDYPAEGERYYLRFEIEDYDGRSCWDPEKAPLVTVNGRAPDYIVGPSSEGGVLDVYVELEFNETAQTAVSVSVDHWQYLVQEGHEKQLSATVHATDTSVIWEIVDFDGSNGTYISSDGVFHAGTGSSGMYTVRCTSKINENIYGETTVTVCEDPVYVTSVKIDEPEYHALYTDTNNYFSCTVEGTDFEDVGWEIISSVSNKEETTISEYGTLYIAPDETAKSITIRATSSFDNTKSDEITLPISVPNKIQGPIDIKYDPDKLGADLSTNPMTVTQRLIEDANISQLGYNNAEKGWYVDDSQMYTCVVLRDYGTDEPNSWDKQTYNEEPFDKYASYYIRFEIEDHRNSGYEWDENNPPEVTVNGAKPDFVVPPSSKEGALDVYVKLTVTGSVGNKPVSLKLKSQPAKVSYVAGETFDPSGMTVKAVYLNGAESDVTEKIEISPEGALKAGDNAITLKYTEGDTTVELVLEITVAASAADLTYTVTFDTGDADPIPSQKVKPGETAKEPANPVLKNLVFDGWRIEGSSSTYDFSTSVNSDIVLKAEFSVKIRSFAYPADAGVIYSSNIDYAKSDLTDSWDYEPTGIASVTAKAKEGYIFKEWRYGSQDGPVINAKTNEDDLYYLDDYNNLTVEFKLSDGGYEFCAVFEEDASYTGIKSIELQGKPKKTSFSEGEIFDASGITVIARFADGTTKDVTADTTYFPEGELLPKDKSITFVYVADGKTFTAEVEITVSGKDGNTPAGDPSTSNASVILLTVLICLVVTVVAPGIAVLIVILIKRKKS